MKILISSCLLGFPCRYDAKIREVPKFLNNFLKKNVEIMAICPEILAFKRAPRAKIMLTHSGEKILDGIGNVVFENGKKETKLLIALNKSLSKAIAFKPDVVILKEKSPSCGQQKVFIHSKGWQKGKGVWAALLQKNINANFFNEFGEKCF